MQRREFITLLSGTVVAWPFVARAQQPSLPMVGYLDNRSPDAVSDLLHAFRQGLKETGFVEGENVAIEYRWAENQIDRLPTHAVELVRRRVAVIAVGGGATTVFAAKAATTTIPIVFGVSDDPVRLGLVASLARPDGNLTGINFLSAEIAAKRLQLLREMVPAASRIAVLVNPANPTNTETTLRDVEPAARDMGLQIRIFNASTSGEINVVFETIAREPPDALFVAIDAFFTSRRVQIAILAARYFVPMTSGNREITAAGGLMSYGSNLRDTYRQMGVYSGRILKGAKPADLPVVRSAKFELVINAETARALGLSVPPMLLARADEVIE